MKNKKRSKLKQKKFWNALALGLLIFSGSALALPSINAQFFSTQADLNLKAIQNNPTGVLNSDNLLLPTDFDYIEEMNREFVKEPFFDKSPIIETPFSKNVQSFEKYNFDKSSEEKFAVMIKLKDYSKKEDKNNL